MARSCYSVVRVLLVLYGVAVLCDAAGTVLDFHEHETKVKRFKCGRPQARAVDYHEILEDQAIVKQIALPKQTVLHRCESAGCCKSGACQERTSTLVDVTVQLYSRRIYTFQARNHTSCACRSLRNIK
ncbi:uncharacterized protein LOC132698604 [Cylas formicarius]|uniref:uncharacterized protein LOC132698604 n=1 Tax=Cylas formicarius TaxID=197179 RepID=UPI0029587BF0|nr:uncharacterized protein LOC132698604 [Cylas formicarius]